MAMLSDLLKRLFGYVSLIQYFFGPQFCVKYLKVSEYICVSFVCLWDILLPNQDWLAKGIGFSHQDLNSHRVGHTAGQWY